MKYIIVLSDGMAGRELSELDGRTTMEAADTPVMDRLAVIPTVYRQQKYMYDSHTHICEDRIVSLEQPLISN